MDRGILCVLFMAMFLETAFCLPSTPKPDCGQGTDGKDKPDCDQVQNSEQDTEPDADALAYDAADQEAWSGTLQGENPDTSSDTIVEGLKKIESGVDELISQLAPDREDVRHS